ncbi:hypothetical protein Ciccas_002648 [Cichlidogyrus casuarinus]|uniref:GRIP domain-containing protein n=1 Tax=Cichlidogyrus casuarinus TaxID=1844966 RepID=A0ABD2QGW0_9PLAT
MHNSDLQSQLQQLSVEFDHLRERCQRHHGPSSPTLSEFSNNYSACHLHEAMEFEYLKNILSQYMCGKETSVLARVVCTIMKFSQEQVKAVLQFEESRYSKIGWPISIIGGTQQPGST